MGHFCLYSKTDIEPYIHSMRNAQRRAWLKEDEEVVERLLDAQTVTIDPGDADYYSGANTPLRTWLSLFDDDGRRARISEVYIDRDRLGPAEVAALREVLEGARLTEAVDCTGRPHTAR